MTDTEPAVCGHFMTESDAGGESCVDCGACLPAGWHDMDEDERKEWS